MPRPPAPAPAAPPPADLLAYPQVLSSFDRRTRAAYEVMGTRWARFVDAKNAFLAAEPGSREWYEAAERAYRLGLRSTHAYYLWTCGHTALALEAHVGDAGRRELRLRLRRELQSLQAAAGQLQVGRRGSSHGR